VKSVGECEAVLARSVGECEAALSWQVSVAPVEAVELDTQEEEAHGTAKEQAGASAEVSATDDACAGAGVEEGWWWWCV
jgi:hypothetical protein